MITTIYSKFYNSILFVKELLYHANPFRKIKNTEQIIDLKKWELSFSDDFDHPELDESIWMTHYYWGTSMVQLDQKQTYTNSPLSISDSCLYIQPKNTKESGWFYKDGEIIRGEYQISSGMIHSGESFKQKYGVFSIKCKLPDGNNLLPSAWLLDKQSWPPKLDVFEFDSNRNYRLTYGAQWGLDDKKYFFEFKDAVWSRNLTNDFHIFTIVWEPNIIKWYLDNRLVAIYSGAGIPQTTMYFVLNLALGQKNDKYSNLIVDWVKFWRLRQE